MNRILKTVLLLVVAPLSIFAQGSTLSNQTKPLAAKEVSNYSRVYTYVEQMPQLPSGGGMAAIVNELSKNLRVSSAAFERYTSRPVVYFEVGPDGNIYRLKLLASSDSPSLDKAILTATRALPRFIPGRQQGKPVTVSFTLPISCIKPQ